MRRLRFHPEAESEAAEAAAWYEQREAGLGRDFLAELDRALSLLPDMPGLWPIWPDLAEAVPVRRCLLSRFPYGIGYAIEGGEIVVLAVAHLSRKPGYWRDRLGDV